MREVCAKLTRCDGMVHKLRGAPASATIARHDIVHETMPLNERKREDQPAATVEGHFDRHRLRGERGDVDDEMPQVSPLQPVGVSDLEEEIIHRRVGVVTHRDNRLHRAAGQNRTRA